MESHWNDEFDYRVNCSFKRLEFITEHRNVENPSLASQNHMTEILFSGLLNALQRRNYRADAYQSTLLPNTLYYQILKSVSILLWFPRGGGAASFTTEPRHSVKVAVSRKTWASETQAPSFFFLEDIWVAGERCRRDLDSIWPPLKSLWVLVKVVEWVRKKIQICWARLYFTRRAKAWLKTHYSIALFHGKKRLGPSTIGYL